MRIPFCPVPLKTAKKLVGSTFYGVAEPVLKVFSSIEVEIKQSEFDLSPRDYVSIAFFSSLMMFIFTYIPFLLITFRIIEIEKALSISFLIASFFFLLTFFYILFYPKVIIKKRMLDIERNLLYALRHLYVQVMSGVPVFDAMVSVADGNYGSVSSQFRRVVKVVQTGVAVDKALDDMALNNPSQYFRRAVWQISNGMKAGSDIGGILKNIVDFISSEQRIAIRKYGSQLNPLTLAYMMVAVIIPSLGVTFLMVLSSFAKVPVTETMFWAILGFVAIFQFMFLGVIKSKRPNII